MSASKLKRCPFCKRDTARFAVNPRPKGPYGKGVELDFGVCCDGCDVFMTTHENVDPSRIINKTTHAYDFSDSELCNEAIAAWNRRAGEGEK